MVRLAKNFVNRASTCWPVGAGGGGLPSSDSAPMPDSGGAEAGGRAGGGPRPSTPLTAPPGCGPGVASGLVGPKSGNRSDTAADCPNAFRSRCAPVGVGGGGKNGNGHLLSEGKAIADIYTPGLYPCNALANPFHSTHQRGQRRLFR